MAEAEVESVRQEPQFAAFVSIDWADKKHVWCLQAAGAQQRESGELEHTPEAVEAWVGQLCQRFAQGPIAVALEQSRGALVCTLSKYEPLHFVLDESKASHRLIRELKSSTWPRQNPAVDAFTAAAANKFGTDSLFVIGRNIYQAACGN